MTRAVVQTRRRDGQAGVSLIEVLVVLAIIGIMTGVSVLGAGLLEHGRDAETEAMRLADRLQLAADEVIVTSRPMALAWDESGYWFLDWDAGAGGWQASAQPSLGPRHTLPAALSLTRVGEAEAAPILISPDLPQPAVMLRVGDEAGGWRIAFDGFAAAAGPAEDLSR